MSFFSSRSHALRGNAYLVRIRVAILVATRSVRRAHGDCESIQKPRKCALSVDGRVRFTHQNYDIGRSIAIETKVQC